MSDSEEEVEYEPETFQLHEHTITLTTVAYLPLSVLMNNRTQDKEISGQKLWCGSACLINYLFKHSSFVNNNDVIELGAGTGVAAIIASRLNAKHIIATDHDKLSLDHMNADFPANNAKIDVLKLDWYSPDLIEIEKSIASSSERGERVVLLAGDVLYKAVLLTPFFTTVKLLLEKYSNGSELLLCHIPRAGVLQEYVQQAAKEFGLEVEILPREDWDDNSTIFQYCPPEDLQRSQMYRMCIKSS